MGHVPGHQSLRHRVTVCDQTESWTTGTIFFGDSWLEACDALGGKIGPDVPRASIPTQRGPSTHADARGLERRPRTHASGEARDVGGGRRQPRRRLGGLQRGMQRARRRRRRRETRATPRGAGMGGRVRKTGSEVNMVCIYVCRMAASPFTAGRRAAKKRHVEPT